MSSTSYNSSPSLPPPPPRSPVIQKRYVNVNGSNGSGGRNVGAAATSSSRSSNGKNSNAANHSRYRSSSNRSSSSNYPNRNNNSISSVDPTRTNPLSTAALATALSNATEVRFSNHGKYISRHPIRVLLLCSLVITSLFYPAVGIYFWSSKGGPGVTRGDAASVWKSLSTPFMDSFISGREHHNSIRDLRMIWDDSHDLKALDIRDYDKFGTATSSGGGGGNSRSKKKSKSSSKISSPSTSSSESEAQTGSGSNNDEKRSNGNCRTIRIEHVFVTADDILKGSGPKHGVLQIPILSSALQLQQTIESATSSWTSNLETPHRIEESQELLSPNSNSTPTSSPKITSSSSSSSRSHSSFRSSLQCIIASTSSPRQSSKEPKCLTLSPLDYFNGSLSYLKSIESPERIPLISDLNQTMSGIPLSIATTLAGRWHLFSKLPRAEHLAFTFFLEVEEQGGDEEDCFASSKKEEKLKNKNYQDEDLENSDYYLDLNQGRKSLSSSSTLVSEPTSDRSRMNGNDGSIYGNGGNHFIERNDGLSQQHSDWMKMLRNVTNGQVRIIPSEHTKAKELLLHFTPKHPSAGLPFPQLFLSFAYLFVLIYIIRGLINTRRVHSRFGIAFTGAMELLISMIMSISLCGLLGIRLNLVPFEILPFVIVVIGSENMSVLIDAIVNTPVSLNVPSRISKGLRKVGVSISVTVISDIVLLGIIANVVMVDAVREFCIFAIFSLVMDYFMQMTFFITVLSIDMQRLELADLLSQGEGGSNSRELSSNDVNSASNRKAKKSNNSSNQPPTSSSFIKTSCRAVWRARTARTASLSLMLALLFGLYLYYGTGYPMLKNYSFNEGQQEVPSWIQSNNEDPSSISSSIGSFTSSPPIPKNSFDPLSHLSPNSVQSDLLPWWSSSPSANFWKALNPNGSPQIKVIIEPWTILSLRAPNSRIEKQISFAGWALFRPRIRAFIWFAKLVVLPIAGTTGLLWGLLLYLLKDTEILEAQFDKDEADTDLGSDLDEGNGNQEGYEDESFESKTDSDRIFDLNISKNSHFNDVEILSESNGMIFSKDLDGNFGIWRSLKKKFERFNLQFDNNFQAGEGLNNGNTITSLSCDSKAKVLAIGKNDGKVLLLNSTNLKPFWSAFNDYASTNNGRNNNDQLGLNPSVGLPTSRVQHLFKHFRNSFLEKSQSVSFLSCHKDGSAWEWLPGGGSPQLRIPSRSHCNWNAFEVDGINGTNSDGRFQREEERGSFDDGGSERNEKAFESRELIAMTTTSTNLPERTNRLEVYERDVGDEIWKLKLSIAPDQESKSDSNGSTKTSAQFKCAAIFEMETTALHSRNPTNSDQVRQNSTSTLKASGSEDTNGDVTNGSPSLKNAQSSSSLIDNNSNQSNVGSEDTNTVSPISNPFDTSNDDSFDDNSSSTSPSTLTLSPRNRLTELLATGDSSGKVSILDFSNGTLLNEIQLNDGPVNKIRVVNEFQRVGSFSERNGCLLIVGTESKTWILQVGSSPSAFLPFGSENFLSSNSGHSRKASNLESSNSSSENGISPTNSPPRYFNGLPQENGGGLSSSSSNGSKRPSSPRQPKVSLPQTGSNFLSANTNLTPNQSSSSNSIPPPPRSPGGRDTRDSQLGHSRSTSHQSTSTSSEYHSVDTSHSKVAGLSSNSTNSNLLSFPLSSHGSSRRRLSAQSGSNGGRSRSFVGEFNERGKLLDEEVFLNSGSTKNQNVNEKGALVVRSLGFISTSRGGFDLIQDSILIGVRRSSSNLFGSGSASGFPLLNGAGSGGSRLRKRKSNIELSVMGEKWQAWTLDLRNDLDSINSVSTSLSSGSSFSSYSRGISRELLVKSQGLNLNGKERLKSNFNVVGSSSGSSRQLRSRRSNPFSSDFKQMHQRKEDFTENLSFNRLKPITRTNGKSNDSLLFGFGNSIARLSIKEEELDRRKGSITKSNALSAMSRR